MDHRHQSLIHGIATKVRDFNRSQKPFYIYHGSTNSTRIQSFDPDQIIDVSQLNRILSIDTKNQTALVESNVAMDQLVKATLKSGLIPPVVPEFPGITVGGAIQGGAGESSSFKWGGINNLTTWMEMILANGEIIEATPKTKSDLFWGSAGAYGSLGIITAIRVKLIPAKKYVSLNYSLTKSFEDAVKVTAKATHKPFHFIDGIMLAQNLGIIMTGRLSDQPVGLVKRFRRAHDEWFYLHAARIARRGLSTTESIPIEDYLFRYDRGAFWMGRYAFERFNTPFNQITRYLLNPLMKTRKMYQALQASAAAQEYIIQDLALPAYTATQFLNFVTKQFNIFPLWLCPLPQDQKSPLHANYLAAKQIINIGVWGSYDGSYQSFVKANRLLERKVNALGGRKWLYAHTYYTEKGFWRIYDKAGYDRLRLKYHAVTLPSVYDKVRVKKRFDVHYKRGAIKAIFHKVDLKSR